MPMRPPVFIDSHTYTTVNSPPSYGGMSPSRHMDRLQVCMGALPSMYKYITYISYYTYYVYACELYNLSQIHFSSLTAAAPPYLLPPSISLCESASTETLYIVNTALDRRHH